MSPFHHHPEFFTTLHDDRARRLRRNTRPLRRPRPAGEQAGS